MKDIIDQYSPILEGVEAEDIKKEVKKKVKEFRLPNLKKLNKSFLLIELLRSVLELYYQYLQMFLYLLFL